MEIQPNSRFSPSMLQDIMDLVAKSYSNDLINDYNGDAESQQKIIDLIKPVFETFYPDFELYDQEFIIVQNHDDVFHVIIPGDESYLLQEEHMRSINASKGVGEGSVGCLSTAGTSSTYGTLLTTTSSISTYSSAGTASSLGSSSTASSAAGDPVITPPADGAGATNNPQTK